MEIRLRRSCGWGEIPAHKKKPQFTGGFVLVLTLSPSSALLMLDLVSVSSGSLSGFWS